VPSLGRGGTSQRDSEKLSTVILLGALSTRHNGASAPENPEPIIVVTVPPANGPT